MLSSHVLDEVQRIANRVGIIRAGRLIAVERLEDLRATALDRVVARLAGLADPAVVARVPGIRDLSVEGGCFAAASPKALSTSSSRR